MSEEDSSLQGPQRDEKAAEEVEEAKVLMESSESMGEAPVPHARSSIKRISEVDVDTLRSSILEDSD